MISFRPLVCALFLLLRSQNKDSYLQLQIPLTPLGRSLSTSIEVTIIFSLYRVRNNRETIRACEMFSQLLKIFPLLEDERLQTIVWDWSALFPSFATPTYIQ